MKSYRVVFAPEAEGQLLDLYAYIAAAASPEIAERFTGAIVDFCERLDSFPLRGTPRDDLRKGLRTLSFRRRTVIAYAVAEDEVIVAGVFYGGQDFETFIRDET